MSEKKEPTTRDETRTRPVLPASLLVAGKPCLVVGGGNIATRKIGHLLDAEAEVTVLSPELSAELRKQVEQGRVRHLARVFADADVEGQCLVFAVTDNTQVNRRIIECCRRHGIPCSASDENWPDGDFVTPAICREAGLIVTVSTGGRSCRHARIVKDRLSGLLEEIVADQDQAHDPQADT